ncbi:hypothetical protein Q8F55_006724 [Vanrija albida]|uniref:BZIP domain-containing protein n=1 Tax=Vanrija albida TaxID=181172 RepID=A0ABR3PXW9_9TREE
MPPSSSQRGLVSLHTFTLIASWRGQLLVCTVVLVFGAIYFVVREPIRQWRRRQRERRSKALSEELLAMGSKDRSATGDDRDRAGPSSASSSALATQKSARERGRERRKELKKRKSAAVLKGNCSTTSNVGESSVATNSSIESSPRLGPTSDPTGGVAPLEHDGGQAGQAGPSTAQSRAQTSDDPITISLESSQSEAEPSPSPQASVDSESPSPDLSLAQASRLKATPLPLAESAALPNFVPLDIDISTDGDEAWDQPDTYGRRPQHSRLSSTYSVITEDTYLHPQPASAHPAAKKKKRKSKARSGSDGVRTPDSIHAPMLANHRSVVNLSSDDLSSSPTLPSVSLSSAPGSPPTPRRRPRHASLVGLPMSPALDLLLDNHERTIDSLRAEIGHAKAEESKARDDEVRAREELRRSRATEDRVRSDYERARKARDRAEQDSRRLEADILVLRSRFETLTHMYQAVCTRLRDIELAAAATQDNGQSSQPHLQLPTQFGTPYMTYSPAGGSGGPGYFQFANGHPSGYPSPLPPHYGMQPHTPYTHQRRGESSNGNADVLAGPLTPGHLSPMPLSMTGNGTPMSQVSSPYPSEMSSLPNSANTPARSSTNDGSSESQLSASELRRLHIASSVLKKKSKSNLKSSGDDSSSSGAQPVAGTESTQPDAVDDGGKQVAGLGIMALDKVQSTFPSVNGTSERTRTKGASNNSSCSSMSSDASSPPPGRHLLITPSNADVFPSNGLSPLTLTGTPTTIKAIHEDDSENDNVFDVDNGAVRAKQNTVVAPQQHDLQAMNSDADFAPMFASLAHTPEQLAEIARMREQAIRDRERRTRARSSSSNDL